MRGVYRGGYTRVRREVCTRVGIPGLGGRGVPRVCNGVRGIPRVCNGMRGIPRVVP